MSEQEHIKLEEFWSHEESRNFLKQFLANEYYLDLVSIAIYNKNDIILKDAIIELFEQEKWEAIEYTLDEIESLWPEDPKIMLTPLIKKSAQYIKQLEKWLCSECETPPPTTLQFIINMLNRYPTDDIWLKIFEACFSVIKKNADQAAEQLAKGDIIKCLRHLKPLTLLDEKFGDTEKLWKKVCEKRENLLIPECIFNHFKFTLPEERLSQLSADFLNQRKVPVNYIQREQIAKYLFKKFYIQQDLENGDVYEKTHDELKAIIKTVDMEWINSKSDPFEKLKSLHQVQCIFPYDAIVNFASSYIEFKNARSFPGENPDDTEIQHIIQAESQVPGASELKSHVDNQHYYDFVKYLYGLNSKIAKHKSSAYIKDGRYNNAFPLLSHSLRKNFSWAKEMIEQHAEDLLKESDSMKYGEQFHFVLHAKKYSHENPYVSKKIKSLSDHYFKDGSEKAEDCHPETTYHGLRELYRSLVLQHPTEECLPVLEQYKSNINLLSKQEFQSLTLEVGDALGEAMSKGSLASAGHDSGDDKDVESKLDDLYGKFKDVVLQQNPYEKKTRETLSEILEEAKALVDEANSIDKLPGLTVYQRLQEDKKGDGYKLLLGEKKSIRSALHFQHIEGGDIHEEQLPNGRIEKSYPEQTIIYNYTELLCSMVHREITKSNNPLLLKLGDGLEDFLNYGKMDRNWWKEQEQKEIIDDKTLDIQYPEKKIIVNDRFMIGNVLNWLRFENEEALKVPYRKCMSIICAHITDGIVSSRQKAEETFKNLIEKFKGHDQFDVIVNILTSLRKSTYQINSLEQLKKTGFLPKNFDRSIEPRVRSFTNDLNGQLARFGHDILAIIKQFLPVVYIHDANEFKLGMVLREKEKSLKRYLQLNLEDLTRSYLKESNRSSIPTKIRNICIRVQQGINFRRGDMKNIRYSTVITEESDHHTPDSILELLNSFEENFPIIERITGSRQTHDTNKLVFKPDVHGASTQALFKYTVQVNEYLANSQKLARQLRIVILPGQGTGTYEPLSNSLCIPMFTGKGRSREMTLLTALADYLYHIKFLNEPREKEQELIDVINKKSKSALKAGTHDSMIKITNLIYLEIGNLCGIDKLPPNPNTISSLVGKSILGSSNTMIYRELRELSSPQKQDRMNFLKAKYQIMKNIPIEKKLQGPIIEMIENGSKNPDLKDLSFNRLFGRLSNEDSFIIKEELYDLGVLLYHFNHFDPSYEIFQWLTNLDQNFAEAFWGLGTVAKHPDVSMGIENERIAISIRSYRTFSTFKKVSAFWKKRAVEFVEKLSVG